MEDKSTSRRLNFAMILGIAVTAAAVLSGIAEAGISPSYLLQPTGLLVVFGGTLGVMLITTPRKALGAAVRSTVHLLLTRTEPRRADLVEEIVGYAREVRTRGLVALEPEIDLVSNGFLKEALMLAMDVETREELQSALESKVRVAERQSDTAAKVLEVAGGFAPTIGVLGTVIGLIDVLRQFSEMSTIAYGVGTAFTATIYGLGLANLVLLPAAHRIRAEAAERFELEELLTEGVLCLYDTAHPRLVRQRLGFFLKPEMQKKRPAPVVASLPEAG
jgi:chemotaxis protein MotA